MRDPDLVLRALYDAIEWQRSYIATNPPPAARAEAMQQIVRYRSMMKRRYGLDDKPEMTAPVIKVFG